jgi:hypothetical protein
MNDKKVIAQYLYDIAEESKSEIIELAKDSELIDIAKKMNLIVPNPDIAILKTIYARTDVPNRNGISLPKEAVEKGLPTLIGKQANWSHLGKNHICGWILDAKLEGEFIIIYVAIFKSIFNEEFDKVQKMFESGSLSCSFEIWNRSEDGKSVLHDLGNNIKSISPIIFHGVGILIGDEEKPACPEAYAKKLLAIFKKDIIKDAENIINSNTEADLIYASLILDELECQKCNKCKLENKGVNNVEIPNEIVKIVAEEAKKLEVAKKLCPECQQPIKDDEEICAVCKLKKEESKAVVVVTTSNEISPEAPKVEETPIEVKQESLEPAKVEATETKVEVLPELAQVAELPVEQKVEEPKAEEVKVEAQNEVEPISIVKIVSEEIVQVTEEMGKSERKGIRKITHYFSDGTNDVSTEEYQVVNTYSQSELEEALKTAKEEIITLYKAELEAKTKELEQKETEIATLKAEKEIEIAKVEEPSLEIGSTEVTEKTEIEIAAANVDKIIAQKHVKK